MLSVSLLLVWILFVPLFAGQDGKEVCSDCSPRWRKAPQVGAGLLDHHAEVNCVQANPGRWSPPSTCCAEQIVVTCRGEWPPLSSQSFRVKKVEDHLESGLEEGWSLVNCLRTGQQRSRHKNMFFTPIWQNITCTDDWYLQELGYFVVCNVGT